MIEVKNSAIGAVVAMAIPMTALGITTSYGDPYKRVIGGQTSKTADYPANERLLALEIRSAWMRAMGFTEKEIAEACVNDGSPIDLKEEREHLYYAERLSEITPPRAVLQSWAINS